MVKIQSYLYYIIQKSCLLVLYIKLDISNEKIKFIEFMLYINHVLEFIYIKMLVMPQPIVKKRKEKKKRKRKKGIRFYGVTHAPPTRLFPTTFPYKISHLFSLAGHTSLCSLFFSFLTNTLTMLSHSLTLSHRYLTTYHHLHHHFFWQDHQKNPQELLSIFIHFI